MHGVAIDWRAWPVLRVTPPPYSISDEALLEFMAFHGRLVGSMCGPHVLVLDLRGADHMGAAQRKKLAAMMDGQQAELGSCCKGAAFVFGSSVMRGMLSAFFWLFRPPYPIAIVPDMPSAMSFAAELACGLDAQQSA